MTDYYIFASVVLEPSLDKRSIKPYSLRDDVFINQNNYYNDIDLSNYYLDNLKQSPLFFNLAENNILNLNNGKFLLINVSKNLHPLMIPENENQESINTNIYNRILLDGDTHKIKLDFNNYDYIGVEIILSHPSKYTTTFNPYETIVISNSTNFLIQDHSFGKSKLVIEKNKSIMQNNLYILFKLKNGQDNKNCFAFLKYNYITNIEDEKYNITNPNITLNEGNKTFKINFEGINPNGNIYLNAMKDIYRVYKLPYIDFLIHFLHLQF